MREAFSQAIVDRARAHPFVFLTGDLGFKALEPVRDALGDRFINCGVAEQNMIGVAAGLARAGEEVWVYSIAPFCVARPFEQIRNDLALHRLRVRLVGNGGGYGYGVMGPSHHALEDYGILLTLPDTAVFLPVFDTDLPGAVQRAADHPGPSYLRLGRQEADPVWETAPAAWRKLRTGKGPLVVACGTIAGSVLSSLADMDVEIWAITELRSGRTDLPDRIVERLNAGTAVIVVEEHRAHGGVGGVLARAMLLAGLSPRGFRHHFAKGYPSGRYGSQQFHRQESDLDPVAIRRSVAEVLNDV